MPHIVHMAVSGICAIIFCCISYAMSIADFEMSPISKRYLGSPHTRCVQNKGCLCCLRVAGVRP